MDAMATNADVDLTAGVVNSAVKNLHSAAKKSSVGAARPPLSFVKRCAFSLIPVLGLLIAAETGARLLVSGAGLGPAAETRFEQIEQIIVYLGNEPGESIFEPDPDCFWRLKPNVVLPPDRGAAWGGVMSNSHGMRSREVSVADAKQRQRVLCFGDSSTFAFGVGFADAWPNQLQRMLDEKQPGAVEVLNAGIPGQTTYQGRQRLTRELVKWRPNLAFITFGNNDGWRWDGRADKEHSVRSGAACVLAVLNHSRAWQWLVSCREHAVRTQATRDQLQWARQATWNYFDPNETWTPRVSLDDFAANLQAMIAECRRYDCEPVLVVWPDQRQLVGRPTWRPPYQAAMRRVAVEAGVFCLDLVPLFEQSGDWAVQRFLPNDVVHLDGEGNRFVAQTVAETVAETVAGIVVRSGDSGGLPPGNGIR
jgi:lysophospholipase L1-like esterase